MEKDFYRDELEVFLQEKADDYAMYPSEKVWKGVRKTLFWKKNWLSLTVSVFVLCLLFFIPESLITNLLYNSTSTGNSYRKSNSPAPLPAIKETSSRSHTIDQQPPEAAASLTGRHALSFVLGNENIASPRSIRNMRIIRSASVPSPVLIERVVPAITGGHPYAAPVTGSSSTETLPAAAESPAEKTVEDNAEPLPQYHGELNWLQEEALIRLTAKRKSPFNLQFYFSPLVSYRTLTDNDHNNHSSQGSTPVTAMPLDINRFVDHQPSIGVELGSNILYRASRNLIIKTGLQLNYSRYTIKAYKVGYQKASIALNTVGHVADTLTSYTTIRNFDGYTAEQLQNQYFQVSMPVGAELKLLGNKRLQLNIAGSIQPTLLLLNDSYLLSTDYVNYTKEPSLVRKWNVHSSAEAYISYQFANVRWQVGPQFRYQLLSSYNDRYPIKEYLMEYGIKFGISKTLR